MSKPDCERCDYAELTVFEPCSHEEVGTIAFECRRFPPQLMVLLDDEEHAEGGSVVQAWPTVHAGDYCGEFKEKAA